MHKNTLIQCNIKIILAISRHLAPLPARRGAFGVMNWKKVLSFRRIFTIQFTHLIICIMAREQEKLSKDVLAVLDKKDERSASGQRDERADGRVQHREHGSGRSAQSPFVRQPNGFGNLFREPSQPIRTPVRPGLKFLSDRYRKTRPYPRLHHPSPRRQGSGRLSGQRDLRLRTQQRGAYRQVRRPL